MDYEESVAAHYGGADVLERLLAVVRNAGGDPAHFAPAELRGTDQLHIGGRAATSRVAERAGIEAGTRVLDIGSGLGGVARHLAGEFGADVHGVDLTPEFVAAARSLTERTGLVSSVQFTQGSALDLPVADGSFDAAVVIHVGMNIRDKDRLFAEAARALRPGGVLAVYDIMLAGGGIEAYPLPWAATGETSFPQPPLAYSDAMGQAGLEVDSEAKPLAEGIAFLERALDGGAPLGLAGPALGNLLDAFRAGLLAPVEIYAHRP
ncbi:class I SAM-dependent methyltransferase [Arthrobacter sp. STN4]|uniref:class I SAM-dependent methyltransferase n=1 Tax=Arthrobacter sp. STN4 TaxID=2923276 RepID=UPI00211A48D4|nr:class I SAM-dependent methyltransferase [Arthrobacter sp. STN4]MCQ9165776.1 class I SAM-dependent methyltransferase [Arthrobacter sp. STN4]